MKNIFKKAIGALILFCLFLLWFIPQVMKYGLLVSILGTLVLSLLVFLFLLSVFLLFG